MKKTLIKNAKIVNEGTVFEGDIFIEGDTILEIDESISAKDPNTIIIDAEGKYVLPGVIDDQVHFREPGLTHKGNIASESAAAVAGGITTFMEQPNTKPQTITIPEWENKMAIAAATSHANYGFMFGGTNNNLDEILKVDINRVPGIKLFLGSSTGNMLVNDEEVLKEIFSKVKLRISLHCEDEDTIKANLQEALNTYGEEIPITEHPKIRSAEACYKSSSKAVELAKQTGGRIHVFHLSTGKETELFDNKLPIEQKQITAEVCIHHLWFSDEDYKEKGAFIKWNPAVKTKSDRDQLWEALLDDRIDVIATDHAPHTIEEKSNTYTNCPSGGPLVQHALPAMLQFVHEGKISIEKVVEKMCHNPARLFDIEKRGYIRKGYKADLVIVDTNNPWTVTKDNILASCGWSPFEGVTFKSRISHTIVNGHIAYHNFKVSAERNAQELSFNR
ncbi:dihydroorotase [Nonlabens tegetincola]|uniref:dihydroorotase n=1 Tax=Nonlabens tegetincola TaxID=323273 RepID=UPI000CF3A2FE|nr:dihydroorotase [Nonlabens tegetincola]PQJ18985.1 dihydroorotase [Nonlabens tegetincola]